MVLNTPGQSPVSGQEAIQLQRQLESILRGKCGTDAEGVIGTFNRMRDTTFSKEQYATRFECGVLYVGPRATHDALDAIESDMATLAQVTFVYQDLRTEDPPKALDTPQSLRSKIELANRLDWSGVELK